MQNGLVSISLTRKVVVQVCQADYPLDSDFLRKCGTENGIEGMKLFWKM